MGVVWMEGFELFGNLTNLKKKYRGRVSDDLILDPGRTGGSCIRLPSGGRFTSELFEPQLTMTIGFAIKVSNVGIMDFVDFRHDTDRILTIGMHSSGVLTVSSEHQYRIQCANVPLTSDQWHYIEVRLSSGPGNGRVTVRLNQQTVYDVQNIYLTSMGWTSTEQLKINNISWYCDIVSVSLDDIYLCDNLGHDNYDFLGPCKVQALLPISDGSIQQWTNPAGGSHYVGVNDSTPDDDSTYIKAASGGQTETFNFPEPLMYGNRIAATSVEFLGMKDAPGLATVAPAVRQNNVVYTGTNQYLNDAYRYHWQCYDHDPASGKPWTLLGLYDAEFGIERTQ